jgi:hypothetical protein|nr:MAG TPA: tail protein [Caudoviricetes sp.]
MIHQIVATNSLGEKLDLDLFNPWDSGVAVKEVTGIGPVKSEVSYEKFALIDGGLFKGVKVGTRNTVLTLIPIGEDIEMVRQHIYEVFPVAEKIDLQIRTELKIAHLDFYVESVEPNIFSENQEIQISLLAMNPFWRSSATQTEHVVRFNGADPMFEFPEYSPAQPNARLIFGDERYDHLRTIRYNGDAPTGVIITFSFRSTVTRLSIDNRTTGEGMSFAKAGMFYPDEQLVVDTRDGYKSIVHRARGKESYVAGLITAESRWLRLYRGDNVFSLEFDADPAAVDTTIEFETLYRGL